MTIYDLQSVVPYLATIALFAGMAWWADRTEPKEKGEAK